MKNKRKSWLLYACIFVHELVDYILKMREDREGRHTGVDELLFQRDNTSLKEQVGKSKDTQVLNLEREREREREMDGWMDRERMAG